VPHNGVIEVQGYAQRAYELSVVYWIDDLGSGVSHDQQRIARSPVVEVEPGTQPASVKLVLMTTLLAEEDR
jgi:hypothetical protein